MSGHRVGGSELYPLQYKECLSLMAGTWVVPRADSSLAEQQLCKGLFIMDFSLLTTIGVSQKRNEAVGNTKPPAMRVEDKLLYKKITFPL